ncbi:MAG TPA: zf-TFIIB domain-containing protein [Victivallales bacterium]|nr:zf-TFIIB domain-containing protein [Victivallales bacterium]HRR06465.1 zf-TFIIB domain-containing protein [Victivallales bacterium]HRR27884.1 zf-TFIIB domain-containing protein [Victivallales bacterium]HRU01705.1 zf-TFIIB domain-containing protein [Victivallales bacterium]
MLCPECAQEMLVIEMNDVEADWCSKCGGIWLDEGELELISDMEGKDSPFLSSIHNPQGKIGKRKCPRCNSLMIESEVLTKPPIELDFCRKKHGIWFDKGELEKVLSSISGEPVAKLVSLLMKE